MYSFSRESLQNSKYLPVFPETLSAGAELIGAHLDNKNTKLGSFSTDNVSTLYYFLTFSETLTSTGFQMWLVHHFPQHDLGCLVRMQSFPRPIESQSLWLESRNLKF